MSDPINPDHYKSHPSGIECIQITEHFGFCIGNAIKYLWRCGLKGDEIEDLKKARWYVEREILKREAKQNDRDKTNAEPTGSGEDRDDFEKFLERPNREPAIATELRFGDECYLYYPTKLWCEVSKNIRLINRDEYRNCGGATGWTLNCVEPSDCGRGYRVFDEQGCYILYRPAP